THHTPSHTLPYTTLFLSRTDTYELNIFRFCPSSEIVFRTNDTLKAEFRCFLNTLFNAGYASDLTRQTHLTYKNVFWICRLITKARSEEHTSELQSRFDLV